MTTIADRLRERGVLAKIPLSTSAQALADGMKLTAQQGGDPETGKLTFNLASSPVPGFDLELSPPADEYPYRLTLEGPAGAPTGFRLAVALNQGAPLKKLLKPLTGLAGHVLRGAEPKKQGAEEWLEPNGAKAELAGAAVALVIAGRVGSEADVSLSPNYEGPDGVLTLRLVPEAVLVGDSGFGFSLPDGLTLDDSAEHAAPGTTRRSGVAVPTPPDEAAWRGIVVRRARFFLPSGVPFLGRRAVDGDFAIGRAPTPGIALRLHIPVSGEGGAPDIDVLVECQDPAGRGLADLVPTLIEAAVTLKDEIAEQGFKDATGAAQALRPETSRPLVLRGRFMRAQAAGPPAMQVAVAVESRGSAGILKLRSESGVGSRIAIAAAALATALAADERTGERPPNGDETGVWLHLLLAAGTGASAFLQEQGGSVTLHGVEIVSEGAAAPLGGTVRLRIDYSVDVVVRPFKAGALSIEMKAERPMRVRVRGVTLSVHPDKSGLEKFDLGFDKADMEVEDAGAWQADTLGSLLDVVGARGGRGSMWIEVELRFKLDLGPVRVSGATVRAVIDPDTGKISGSLRGLEASLTLAPLVSGKGALDVRDDGFSALLGIRIIPLDMGAEARLVLRGDMVMLRVVADLPGPVPLANSGLGLYAIGGFFAANGRPRRPGQNEDAVTHWLDWRPGQDNAFTPDAGANSFGLEAVIGTAPDLGFSFSAHAMLAIVAPDVAVLGGLDGRILSPRARLAQDTPAVGPTARGIIVVDPKDGVTIGLRASYEVPQLLKVAIPIGARFPFAGVAGGVGPRDWYVHIGADGLREPVHEGRGIGPVHAVILPGTLEQHADAYVMFRGNGITKWPRGGPTTITGSFVLAFGAGFEITIGVRGLVWAEVRARADILMATNPLLLVGSGMVAGSLNLGPVSVGLEARLNLLLGAGREPWIAARLCARVKLLFFKVEGCVSLSFGKEEVLPVPEPSEHPLERREGDRRLLNIALSDDGYHAPTEEDGALDRMLVPSADPAAAPVVWPDAILLLTFASAPRLAIPGMGAEDAQFPAAAGYPEGQRPVPLGSDLLEYEWTLTGLALHEATQDGQPATPVPGPLSAAWLFGKFGDAGGQPEPAELALLTPERGVWLSRVPKGGAKLPHDPLKAQSTICQVSFPALPGWALGIAAEVAGTGYALPPEYLSPDPLQSRLRATLTLWYGARGGTLRLVSPLTLDSALLLVPELGWTPPRLVPDALREERDFAGWLDLGGVKRDAEQEEAGGVNGATLVPEEAIVAAEVWLRAAPGAEAGIQVRDQAGAWPAPQVRLLPDGEAVLVFSASGREVTRIDIVWQPRTAVGFLGLVGITASARAAAAVREAARAAEAAALEEQAKPPPPEGYGATGKHARNILKPGKLYRLQVDMAWTGTLYQRAEDGGRVLASAQHVPQSEFRPNGPDKPRETTTRVVYFRTAPEPPAPARPAAGARLFWLRREVSSFEPEMLERHLLGYEPAQAEEFRFRKDRLGAHFAVRHVAALAAAYGYTLGMELRRTDRPGPPDRLERMETAFVSFAGAHLAGEYAAQRIELAVSSPCVLPLPGTTLAGQAELAPRAWYDLRVVVRKGDAVAGRLPGVTFRSSEWEGVADMMAALGFPTHGEPGGHAGDVELRDGAVAAPPLLDGSDAAFDAALDRMGLGAWPRPAAARTSLLWRLQDGAWLCLGALLDSPEPIERLRRCSVKEAVVVMGGPFATRPRLSVWRDRGGARLLVLADRPFRPVRTEALGGGAPPLLQLVATEGTVWPLPGVERTGSLVLPLQPAFAEEA